MLKINKMSDGLRDRLGQLKTLQGSIQTPFFMPDATYGFVKLLNSEELNKIKVQGIVVNTLHLSLRPGIKIIKKAGGIHNFINWLGLILSDSGGYQIFSLIHRNPRMGKIYDRGAVFKSPLDGSKKELTPKKSIQIQFDLGVDAMVCLDDCPPNEYNNKDLEKSVIRTIRWAKECRLEYDRQVKERKLKDNQRPLLFAVIQGGENLDLRKECAQELIKIGFDGYGFGARPVDQEGKFLNKVLEYTANLIPDKAIRFALGIGLPEDIVKCAKMGWDMFDCVIPTREGRHGKLFFFQKKSNLQIPNCKFQIASNFYKTININNAKFARDFLPVNPDSKILELRKYSKAYLHHLFKLKEPLGQRLASLNNLEFFIDLMKEIRNNIKGSS